MKMAYCVVPPTRILGYVPVASFKLDKRFRENSLGCDVFPA